MPVTLIRSIHAHQSTLVAEFGTVCAVTAQAEAGRFVWSALLGAAPTMPAWLLTGASTPVQLTPPAALERAVDAALESRMIQVLRHHMARPAARDLCQLLREFDCFHIAAGSLLIIDCADYWFAQPPRNGRPSLISQLQQWAQRRRVAVVLVFHTMATAGRKVDRATELLQYAQVLAGVARITSAAQDAPAGTAALQCELLFWFGLVSVVTSTTLPLQVARDGFLQRDDGAGAAAANRVVIDSDTVIVQRSALAGSGGAPAHWIVCDALPTVVDAAVGAQAATVILTFERTTPQDLLMQTVYRLRQQSGQRLKIIVRELQVRLRYNEEALIARLGANLIVPMEVSYARFLSMMEILQSQVYAASLPPTYEQARIEGLPQQEAGYLAPQAFAQSVTQTLARARSLAIDNVLVRLTLGSGLTALDALRHCTVKRAGDIYSCDRKTVLVFLFACRENDATQTLERIFALPVGELFSTEHRYISNVAATAAIGDFSKQAASGRLPDLSTQLEAINARRTTTVTMALPASLDAASTVRAAGAGAEAGTAVVDMALRMPAGPVHAPLRLRENGAIGATGRVP